MKAYRHLVKFALNNDLMISVWDGEEWQVKKSTKFTAIIDAIESVEEAVLKLRDKETNESVATAVVSAYGLEDDETVMDWSDCEFMNQWDSYYTAA